jgi:hypothetical protein
LFSILFKIGDIVRGAYANRFNLDLLVEDIEFYLRRGRQTYLSSRNLAVGDADLIIDGSKPLNEIVDCVKSKISKLTTQ